MPTPQDKIGEQLVEIGEWWASYLSPADRDYMASFETTIRLEVGSTPVLFFHGSPRSYDEWIFSTTPEEEVRSMFADVEERVLVGGHTHVQMIRRYADSIIVNPGSVGLAFRSWWPRPVRISPWAEYGVLDGEDERLSIDLRRTPFDVSAFLEMSLKSGMPHAEWWVQSWSAA
jgi:predicted phosphodiesterase